MNKLRLIAVFLLSILLFTDTVKAQEVLYSPYDKFDFRNGDFSVVGMCGGHLYTYRASGDGYFLDAYNDSMQKTATVVLDFFPSKIYQTQFITYGDQIMVLYQAIEGNKVVQYAALLDGAGRLKKGPVQLDEAHTGILGPTRTYFSSAISENKKQIIVYSAETKGRELTFTGKWIDDQLNVAHRGHAVYKADNELAHGEAMVSNDGILYIPAYTPVGSHNYYDQVWLLSLTADTTRFTAKELPLNSVYVGNIYMKVDNFNKRVYAGGFFSNKKNGSYDGIIYAYYDIASNAFPTRKNILFDPQLVNASGVHKKKRAFDNYQVKQLIVKNDGGFVLISESYYMTLRSSYAPGFGYYSWYYGPYMAASVREYHYDDIMALSYDGNGVREWASFIPKSQYSQEDGGLFSSYALLNTGGTLAFLYNDFNTTHSRIQLATLDVNGKIDMHSFTAEGNDYPDWLPRSAKQVAGRSMVVPCLHKRQICFAKVVF